MCGIVGYIGNFEKDSLNKAIDYIKHRGPDGYGTFIENNCGLGHVRLAIIDTSENAKQPLEVLNRFVITYNGEIYNYKELRKELESDGVVFKSESDTEVLLQSYLKWGPKCLSKFNGMWAFAIYDKITGDIFLSRDRLGKKPLFYHKSSKGLVFGSEMKAIYPFLNQIIINKEIANAAMNDSFCYEFTNNCLIKNIERFPAAHYAIYSNGNLRLERFWDLENIKPNAPAKYSGQVEMFKELFLDACKLRMRSDVKIGTALSGGLDSSSTISAMNFLGKQSGNEIQTDWQNAFVASFPGTALDETAYAKKVVNHLGIEAHYLNIDPTEDLDKLFFRTFQFEELYYAPLIPFVQLYKNINSHHVKVSIDGHGADELFGGYPFDMNAALIDSFPNPIKYLKSLEAVNLVSGKNKHFDFVNKLKFTILNKYPFAKSFAKNLNTVDKRKNQDYLNSALLDSTSKRVLPTLLRNYDRYSMINGVEIRMPFLDYRIVEFAFSIPYSSKVRGGYSKAIVRDAMKDFMPHDIAYRKNKIGFNAPTNNWLKKELKQWIIQFLNSDSFNDCSLINTKEVKQTVLYAIENTDMNFFEASNIFEKLNPAIWESSFSYAR
jgi:asparagine synthase (glutamine-hydrolysing)